MMSRKEFLLAQVEKALDERDERKVHILIDKFVSFHICPQIAMTVPFALIVGNVGGNG